MRANAPRGDMQDRLRKVLLEYGTKDIDCTVDILVGKTGLLYPQVYQALYRLQNLGEISIIKEDENSPRSPIIGITLMKMAPINQVQTRLDTRHAEIISEKAASKVKSQVPHVLEYIKEKIAVENAIEALSGTNLNPEEVIKFTPDPLGEEALILLQELTDTKKVLSITEMDLQAARRDNEFLKRDGVLSESRT